MENAGKSLAESGPQLKKIYQLSEVLKDSAVQAHLAEANIFIFGKVGFFDLIQKSLVKYMRRKKKKVLLVRNFAELQSIEGSIEQYIPLFLVPTAKNRDDLNSLVTAALETRHPVWLVALPSQIEKHLLILFNFFFIAPHSSKREILSLTEVTFLLEGDIEEACRENSLQAILLMEHSTRLSLPDRLGSVIYIHNLS